MSSHISTHGNNILQDLKKKEGSTGDGQAAEITDGSATKAGTQPSLVPGLAW